ncbi:MAG TPA: addiction module protein [Acidobacteriaceae bacterium]|nr:addiction module protein [Acidobacteriaceae bacterium]
MHYPTRTEIEELSTDDRLRLIGDVWDTLEPNSLPLPDGHREILEERLAQLDRNPETTVSREEMMQRVRSGR